MSSRRPASIFYDGPPRDARCWLMQFARDRRAPGIPLAEALPHRHCEGRLVKAHLIRKQVIERECPDVDSWDPAVWVWACGGMMGNGGHHGMLDAGHRPLIIPRMAIPLETEMWAAEHGLDWWLDREYGTS